MRSAWIFAFCFLLPFSYAQAGTEVVPQQELHQVAETLKNSKSIEDLMKAIGLFNDLATHLKSEKSFRTQSLSDRIFASSMVRILKDLDEAVKKYDPEIFKSKLSEAQEAEIQLGLALLLTFRIYNEGLAPRVSLADILKFRERIGEIVQKYRYADHFSQTIKDFEAEMEMEANDPFIQIESPNYIYNQVTTKRTLSHLRAVRGIFDVAGGSNEQIHTLLGQLGGMRSLMQTFAQDINSFRRLKDATAEEKKEMAQSLIYALDGMGVLMSLEAERIANAIYLDPSIPGILETPLDHQLAHKLARDAQQLLAERYKVWESGIAIRAATEYAKFNPEDREGRIRLNAIADRALGWLYQHRNHSQLFQVYDLFDYSTDLDPERIESIRSTYQIDPPKIAQKKVQAPSFRFVAGFKKLLSRCLGKSK